jgi:hypothetical protein
VNDGSVMHILMTYSVKEFVRNAYLDDRDVRDDCDET